MDKNTVGSKVSQDVNVVFAPSHEYNGKSYDPWIPLWFSCSFCTVQIKSGTWITDDVMCRCVRSCSTDKPPNTPQYLLILVVRTWTVPVGQKDFFLLVIALYWISSSDLPLATARFAFIVFNCYNWITIMAKEINLVIIIYSDARAWK